MPHTPDVSSPTPVRTTPWLDVYDAARYCQLCDDTLRRAVARGTLKAVRVDGRRALRFRVQWLDEWLDRFDAKACAEDEGTAATT